MARGGRSWSSRGSAAGSAAAIRARASKAARRPAATGATRVSSVHTAATAMVPAPMKRTRCDQMPSATAESGVPAACGVTAVSTGTATSQLSAAPSRMARPPVSPTR